jgi:two-component system, NtrC family, sensor kinase
LVNGFPIVDKTGKISEIVISFIDFTQQKNAEEELSNTAKELKKAQQLAQIGSWQLNLETDELSWN